MSSIKKKPFGMNNEEPEKKVAKKRGRKPKKKEIINENPKFSNEQMVKNLVIKLDVCDHENININGFDNNYDDNLNHINEGDCKKSELCWNCCHGFHNIIHGIPLKYVNEIFYIYGDFCSLECGMRYVYENFKENKWEIYSLINLYHKKVLKNENKINIPLSKLSLTIFGGNLTIDEYRKTFNKVGLHDLIIPHIIPINHEIETYENKIISNQDLKLYRKKPLKNDKQKITHILDN